MNEMDASVFGLLFREACLKCFGHPLAEPLTETESKLMYARILEETGLVIGWKSIKNYSFFVLSTGIVKPENPSVATLDTLSRYVANAPYTTEPERKKTAGHYPYWYDYKARLLMRGEGHSSPLPPERIETSASRWPGISFRKRLALACMVVLLALAVMLATRFQRSSGHGFEDHFSNVSADSLRSKGWWLESPDSSYWKRRGETPGCLTLYTLQGDNWPDSSDGPVIRNLLMHDIDCDCWTVEVHWKDLLPSQNWQQAGILLMEDTGFRGASMRVSIAYNDYNGVYPRSGSILLQGIASRGQQEDKPEEFVHIPLLQMDSLRRHPALARDLASPALRIERRENRYRILYADGVAAHTSFREISNQEFPLRPRYIGLFAIRGHVDTAGAMPARFTYIRLDCCKLP